MTFLDRLMGRTESRAVMTQKDLALVEILGGGATFGQRVNHIRLEWLSAATAAIDAIAGTMSSLPSFVYRLSADGRTEDPTHPLAVLIADGPNPSQTWPDFILWLIAQTLRHGNGLAEIVGDLDELRPIPWDIVAPKLLDNGRLVYDFTDPVTRTRRRLLDTEVLHLRDRSDDGLIGRPRHERAHPVIATALALTDYVGSNYANGAYLSGVLEHPKKLSEEAQKRLRDQWSAIHSGTGNAGKTAVLEEGMAWKAISATPEDMELLASRRFAIEEAARLYQVPPPIIGDLSHGTFTNSETLIRFFAVSTITTWARKLESEVHRSLFSASVRRTHRFDVDLSGLLRGDPETRWKSHEIALRNRVLTPNEVREAEGWNPRPGGDDVLDPASATN